MNRKQLRALAIALLDDGDGINRKAYEQLREALVSEGGCMDIISIVEAQNDRFFLPEEHGLQA